MDLLTENARISRVMNGVAAGTTVQTSSAVDMAADGGYDGVLFIAMVGALTANQVTALKAQQSSDDGSADAYSDIEGSKAGPLADGDSNDCLAIDIYRPTKRYLKAVLLRATANAVIDGIVAIQYKGRLPPVSQAAELIDLQRLVSPAEGAA
jgi:hypothetical protein